MVNYNGIKYLKKCFDSLFKLNYPKNKFEIILVDNCSTDDSFIFVKKRYPRVILIKNGINNYCKANNMGVRRAKGKYVALINNDMKVDKNWLIELVNVIEKDKNIAAVGSKILTADGKYIQNAGHYELPNFYWGERGAGREKKLYNDIEEVPSLCGASILYRKSCIQQVGLFDEDFIIYGEDVDMSYRLKKAGYKLLFAPKSKVNHIFHGSGNEELSRFYIERNRLLFLAKYFPWKLSNSLFGKGAFIVNKGLKECGKLFEILPDVVFIVLKTHPIYEIKDIITSLFEELRKILNYENDKLIEEIKEKHMLITEYEKEFKNFKEKEKELVKLTAEFEQIKFNLRSSLNELSNKNNILSSKDKEIVSLSSQLTEKDQYIANLKEELTTLSQRIYEVLIKDGQLIEKEQEINNLREELTTLSNQLKQRMDEVLIKDGQLIEKEQEINNLREELTTLSNQLKQRMDEVLIKDGQLIEKEQEINNLSKQLKNRIDDILVKNTQLFQREQSLNELKQQLSIKNSQLTEKDQYIANLKEELTTLSNQLKQRMDEVLIKDGQLIEKDQQLTNLHEEFTNLTNQLKHRMDEVLIKDGQLIEKDQHLSSLREAIIKKEKELDDAKVHLKQKINELNGIYNSDGFRFILRPLWTILWSLKIGLKKLKTALSTIFLVLITILLSPLFFFVSLSFFLENLTWKLLKFSPNKKIPERRILPFDSLKISIVIPSWNGINLLKECLNSIFVLAEFKGGENEILVIDDGSTDGTFEFVKQNYPNVRIIHNEKNMGFGYTCNRGVKEAKNELIVLINNDILMTEGFLEPLKEHFKDESIFSVTPKLYGWDRKTFKWGMHIGHFKNGYISLWNEADTPDGEGIYNSSPTIFAIGGAMVFRKSDFLWLGGFDEIYRPNCWEDIDISYRAWKRGLRVIYEPRSLMYHKGKATLTYERHKEIKNEISFTWKNITDWDILKEHLNLLPLNLQKQGYLFLKGFLWALNLLPLTLFHRLKERRFIQQNDNDIFKYCMHYYENFRKSNFRHFENAKRKVLIISLFLPYPLNMGGNIRIYSLAKLLKDKYDIYLMSLIHNRGEFEYIPRLKEVFKDVFPVYKFSPSVRDALFPERYKYAYSRDLIEKLKEIQNALPLDIIQIESNELLYLLDVIKFTPVIYTEHDSSVLSFKNSYYNCNGYNALFDFYEYLKRINFHKNAYKRLKNVITLSKYDTDFLKTMFSNINFHLVCTGVDIDFFSYENYYDHYKKLIFVGHYKHYPNEDAIVYFVNEILPLIRNQLKDVELLVVGSEPTKAVKSLSKHHNVNIVGTVDDIKPYLRSVSVFINPIRISAGIKGKVLEAMACGIPVVSTRQGAFGIDAEPEKEILIADSSEHFAEQVVRLLKNDGLYLKLAQNARKLVEIRYNWKDIAKRLDNVYSGIITNSLDFSYNTYIDRILHNVNNIVDRYIEDAEIEGPQLGPEELHIELTYNCDSKCIMCDLWDYNKRTAKIGKELTKEEIGSLIKNSSYLKRVKTVVLSGGEPFLRKDITDICGIILKYLPDVSLTILTNGLNTEVIINKTKEILRKYSPKSICLGSSLDGLGDIHDYIRGKKGAFLSLEETIKRCKSELPEVNLALTFTLTPYNFKHLLPAKEFANKHKISFYAQFVVPKTIRGRFKWTNSYFKKITDDIYSILNSFIEEYNTEDFLKNIQEESFDNEPLAKFYYWGNLVRYQKTPKRYFKKCIAGSRFAMLNPFGDVFFCPILKDRIIGNIREENFDKVWMSDKAKRVRDYIDEEDCHCWLVCIVFPLLDEVFSNKKQQISLPSYKTTDYVKAQQENIELNEKELEEGKIILNSKPQIVGIGAHYNCNAKCIFCLDGDYPHFNLDIYKRFFERRLGHILPLARALNLCGYGELLLMPDILSLLNYLNDTLPHINKIITTNGIPLNGAVSERIIKSRYNIQISLHASNKHLHKLLTGIDVFEKIVKQIEKLISIRPNNTMPGISLIFVINSLNINDLPEFVRFAIDLGVDEVICNYMTVYKPSHFKLSCFYKQEVANEMILKTEEIAKKYKFRLRTPPKFNQILPSRDNGDSICSEPWKYFYVETQGSVLPCCYANKHIGYLNKKDFVEIWNGEAYQELRKSQIQKSIDGICKNCYKLNEKNVNDILSHINVTSLEEHGFSIEDIKIRY